MVKNIPNLMKSMNLPVQKFQRSLSRINSRRSALRHIIIKVSEAKDNLESNERSYSLHTRDSQQDQEAISHQEPEMQEDSGTTYSKC